MLSLLHVDLGAIPIAESSENFSVLGSRHQWIKAVGIVDLRLSWARCRTSMQEDDKQLHNRGIRSNVINTL